MTVLQAQVRSQQGTVERTDQQRRLDDHELRIPGARIDSLYMLMFNDPLVVRTPIGVGVT